MQTTDNPDERIINSAAFDQWNHTALGECGRYHEAQARTLREFLKLGINLTASKEACEADIAMHTRFATACAESQ